MLGKYNFCQLSVVFRMKISLLRGISSLKIQIIREQKLSFQGSAAKESQWTSIPCNSPLLSSEGWPCHHLFWPCLCLFLEMHRNLGAHLILFQKIFERVERKRELSAHHRMYLLLTLHRFLFPCLQEVEVKQIKTAHKLILAWSQERKDWPLTAWSKLFFFFFFFQVNVIWLQHALLHYTARWCLGVADEVRLPMSPFLFSLTRMYWKPVLANTQLLD